MIKVLVNENNKVIEYGTVVTEPTENQKVIDNVNKTVYINAVYNPADNTFDNTGELITGTVMLKE
tara:strand:+ start:603 stop:797 length:195 start_codon:yes stop_codon:yes gene_type:complete